jgi:hypothetical protein
MGHSSAQFNESQSRLENLNFTHQIASAIQFEIISKKADPDGASLFDDD